MGRRLLRSGFALMDRPLGVLLIHNGRATRACTGVHLVSSFTRNVRQESSPIRSRLFSLAKVALYPRPWVVFH